MDWAEFWQEVKRRVDKRKGRSLTLAISEIRAATGTLQNIDRAWWWELVCDGKEVASAPMKDYGLTCEPHVDGDLVTAVTFRRI